MNRVVVTFAGFMGCIVSALAATAPVQAVYDLIERVTPGYSPQFQLELIKPADGSDEFEITSRKGKVVLRGTSPVALASAFNHYLKYDCNAHLSWQGDQLNLTERLPLPKGKTRTRINGRYRVYLNYCTVSYSAAWWNWERWQREIDYMAMNGINMPLTVVGLEAVWYNTLLRHGFSDIEARKFLTDPAHAAWQWMQNLQGSGRLLPKEWIESHKVLGKQIIDRELELGMQPIQQGFSGYVPRELRQKYPKAKIQMQPSWCGYTGAAQLDPTDSLFQTFGRDFLEEMAALYGAHGVYAADPFHESAPPVDTPEYLNAVGHVIHKMLKDFDGDAVWAMQAWSLREPIVKAVPKSDLLILDLNGESIYFHDGFWGYPAIVGNLHNFGGRINLHGDLSLLASNQYMAAVKKYPNVAGSGLFMESIEQNPVYYDLAFEMPLHADSVDISRWLTDYARRRYGAESRNAAEAWQLLLQSAYRPGTNGTENSSIVAARPALNVKKSGPNAGFDIPYDPECLVRAEKLLLADADRLGSSAPYSFDVIDVQRQIMSNLGQSIHRAAAKAFREGDAEAFGLHSSRFLELLSDMDALLRTRPEFNFDRFLGNVRSWGTSADEKDLYERAASELYTVWGADGDPLIFDYSWKEWSGLIKGYYLPRWERFYAMLANSLRNGTGYSEEGLALTHGREAFRANDFYSNLGDWELRYVATPGKARVPAVEGDPIVTARRMYDKYTALGAEYSASASASASDAAPGAPVAKKRYENLGEKE